MGLKHASESKDTFRRESTISAIETEPRDKANLPKLIKKLLFYSPKTFSGSSPFISDQVFISTPF